MKMNRRGIVLVSILILTLLATFFLGALIQLNPGRLRRTAHDEKRDKAAMAGRAGVDYVLNRLKSDLNWRADANAVVVNTDELVIREDRGNVLGWIKTDDGAWAGFRVRFNAQDGPGGSDNLHDPVYPIHSKEISLNNLSEGTPRDLFRGTGSNYQPSSEIAMTVPENTVAIIAEGVVIPDLDPSNPNTLAQATSGTTRAVEGIYKIISVTEGVDSDAVLSSMEADIEVKDKLSLQSGSDNVARMRLKDGLNLHDGDVGSQGAVLFDPDENASVLTHSTKPFTALTSGDTFSGGVEDVDAAFLEIAWDSVQDSAQTDPHEIPGGVYIFTEGNEDSGRTLEDNVKYFDMTWTEYRNRMINGPEPVEQPLPPGFAALDIELDVDRPGIDGKRDLITIKKDVKVVASDTGKKDISIVPKRGARQTAGDDPDGDELPVLAPGQEGSTTQAQGYLSVDGGLVKTIASVGVPMFVLGLPEALDVDQAQTGFGQGEVGVSGSQLNDLGPGASVDLYNLMREGQSFKVIVPNSGKDAAYAAIMERFPAAEIDDSNDTWVINPGPEGPAMLGGAGGGPGGTFDPLHIPKKANGSSDPNDPNYNDETVPQDIEIAFEPEGDEGSALIRSEANVFLGTHLSGRGGGVVAKGNVSLIGFGIDISATPSQSTDQTGKASLAVFSGEDGSEGINISTYDERQNKYWDVDIEGAVFSKTNLNVRLGQDPLPEGTTVENPPWGKFHFAGAIVSLGNANSLEDSWTPNPGGTGGWGNNNNPIIDGGGNGDDGPVVSDGPQVGVTKMIADSVTLFFDPRFLAPYVEEESLSPTFAAVSVVER